MPKEGTGTGMGGSGEVRLPQAARWQSQAAVGSAQVSFLILRKKSHQPNWLRARTALSPAVFWKLPRLTLHPLQLTPQKGDP